MTIRRGEAWGSEIRSAPLLGVASSDADLAAMIVGDPTGAFAVSGGDLHRTVGHPAAGRDVAWRLPIDVLRVRTETSTHIAVAHVTIRRSWWRGPLVFVCNVDHVGSWNVAPRAHPNDGRFDVVTVAAEMTLRDRLEFRRRLPTGRHVPHPAVGVTAATTWGWHDPAGSRVRVDGVDIGTRTSVEITIEADAAAVHV
jgi:hypothetical protein